MWITITIHFLRPLTSDNPQRSSKILKINVLLDHFEELTFKTKYKC